MASTGDDIVAVSFSAACANATVTPSKLAVRGQFRAVTASGSCTASESGLPLMWAQFKDSLDVALLKLDGDGLSGEMLSSSDYGLSRMSILALGDVVDAEDPSMSAPKLLAANSSMLGVS